MFEESANVSIVEVCTMTGSGREEGKLVKQIPSLSQKLQPDSRKKARSIQEVVPSSSQSAANAYVPQIKVKDVQYRRADEIGRGAFGIVYRGKWLGTDVAIKEIKGRNVKLLQGSIKREVQIHSRIRHPNIVQLMATAVEKNTMIIVSEYIDGPNMDDLLFTGEHIEFNIPNDRKPYITKQLCQAISYMHENNIIHQDIKPANILIAKNTMVTKICDMGVSKLIKRHTTLHAGSSAIAGTPSYMAPECLIQQTKASTMSDMWSLGITLIELYTKHHAWGLDKDESTHEGSLADDNQEDDLQQLTNLMVAQKMPCSLETLITEGCYGHSFVGLLSRCVDYCPDNRPSALECIDILGAN
ncbi:uncharacterized protein LOC100374872 [Saccoglossus kowalevskii]